MSPRADKWLVLANKELLLSYVGWPTENETTNSYVATCVSCYEAKRTGLRMVRPARVVVVFVIVAFTGDDADAGACAVVSAVDVGNSASELVGCPSVGCWSLVASMKAGFTRSIEILSCRPFMLMTKYLAARLMTRNGPKYGATSESRTRSFRTKTCVAEASAGGMNDAHFE